MYLRKKSIDIITAPGGAIRSLLAVQKATAKSSEPLQVMLVKTMVVSQIRPQEAYRLRIPEKK